MLAAAPVITAAAAVAPLISATTQQAAAAPVIYRPISLQAPVLLLLLPGRRFRVPTLPTLWTPTTTAPQRNQLPPSQAQALRAATASWWCNLSPPLTYQSPSSKALRLSAARSSPPRSTHRCSAPSGIGCLSATSRGRAPPPTSPIRTSSRPITPAPPSLAFQRLAAAFVRPPRLPVIR